MASILPAGDLTIDESLRVYANDYRARLLEAMSKNYEMTWLVLGDDLFFDLHKMFLFKSDWNLPFLWRKREDGISEEESGMIHFDELKYWVMLKMENKVEVLELNSNEYSCLVLLKEKKNIIEMNEALKTHNLNELTSLEWVKVLGILSYADVET